jgi:hypothetical protein
MAPTAGMDDDPAFALVHGRQECVRGVHAAARSGQVDVDLIVLTSSLKDFDGRDELCSLFGSFRIGTR